MCTSIAFHKDKHRITQQNKKENNVPTQNVPPGRGSQPCHTHTHTHTHVYGLYIMSMSVLPTIERQVCVCMLFLTSVMFPVMEVRSVDDL